MALAKPKLTGKSADPYAESAETQAEAVEQEQQEEAEARAAALKEEEGVLDEDLSETLFGTDQLPTQETGGSADIPDSDIGTGLSLDVNDDDDADGFGDLEKDVAFGSFPMVKLDNAGNFVSSEGHELESLDVVFVRMMRKTLFKARKGQDDDIPFVYSYNNKTDMSGRPLQEYFDEWRENEEIPEGAEPVSDEYIEIVSQVVKSGDDELDGEFVILNVAPASKRRLAAYKIKCRSRSLKVTDVITRVCKGKKIVKGKKEWFPWDFKIVAKVAKR